MAERRVVHTPHHTDEASFCRFARTCPHDTVKYRGHSRGGKQPGWAEPSTEARNARCAVVAGESRLLSMGAELRGSMAGLLCVGGLKERRQLVNLTKLDESCKLPLLHHTSAGGLMVHHTSAGGG